MTEGYVIELVRQMLVLLLTLAGPMLAGALIVGTTVSIVQAATSIQEQSITFFPKVLLAVGSVTVGGPWALDKLVEYATMMFREIGQMGPGHLG
jgi:flagellar biosynthetic protein FliQ